MREIQTIAVIETDYPEKFGVPRQSGMTDSEARIRFLPPFDHPDCFRGIEGFSHLWLIWGFSKNPADSWSPTVRPPRLGGNRRVGVFASRSPFRPNGLGLSCVELKRIEYKEKDSPLTLVVTGADMVSGTPIYDVKPYIPYGDARPEASSGFLTALPGHRLEVDCAPALLALLPAGKDKALLDTLALDPRPAYQDDPDRVYGLSFMEYEVHFQVKDHVLHVLDLSPR